LNKKTRPALDPSDYQRALDSLNACNLSGLAKSLAKVTTLIWAEARAQNEGTDWVNKHPIVVLYVSQMAMLSGVASIADMETFSRAYEACERKAKEVKGSAA